MNAEERLLGRFKAEFENKNLANVKFFVTKGRVSAAELYDEINQFEAMVAAGDAKAIDTVDAGFQKTRYDAPF